MQLFYLRFEPNLLMQIFFLSIELLIVLFK